MKVVRLSGTFGICSLCGGVEAIRLYILTIEPYCLLRVTFTPESTEVQGQNGGAVGFTLTTPPVSAED